MDFFLRGLTYHDEGQIVYAAHQVLHGLHPYRDFHFIYTPLSLFITSMWFSLFYESLFSARMLMFFTVLFSCIVIFFLLRRSTNNRFVSFLSSLLFLSWAIHINFPWPASFAILFGLMAIWMFQRKQFATSGIAIALTFLSKQNFGVALILSFCFSILFTRSLFSKEKLCRMILGFFIIVGIFFLYLFLTNSFVPFFRDMYWFSVEKIVIQGVLTTPFWYGPQSLFYLLLPVVSTAAVGILFRQKKARGFLLFPNLFVIFFYLFGIRPTTDYVHLVSLFGLIAIPFATLFCVLKQKIIRIGIVCLMIALTLLGFYTAFFKGYYRWEAPLVSQNNYLDLPKAHIYTDTKYSTLLPPLIKGIQTYTKPGEYIFVYDYAPLLYFLANRENATRWNILQSQFLNEQDEEEVIQNLKQKNVRLVITTIPLTKTQNVLIESYILQNYKPKKSYGEFTIYVYR